MALSNREKAKHGDEAQNNIAHLLALCFEFKYIKRYKPNYRTGRPGYTNKTQFYSPFLIEFADGTEWLIYSTTSFRNDRIKEQQWDAYNIKEINNQISAAYLVYPDSTNEGSSLFINASKKILNKEIFSAIDDIISQDVLFNYIENYALSPLNPGQRKDLEGRNFEKRIAYIISSKSNLEKWKGTNTLTDGVHYPVYQYIIEKLGIQKNVTKIKATADDKDIGLLPSGGKPKTDIIVSTLTILPNCSTKIDFYTISCKRTSEKNVSMHQYSADKFSAVLDSANVNLKNMLFEFQLAGSLSAFGEKNCIALEKEIKPYIKKLVLWVLGGIGGEYSNENQIANYLLTYNNISEELNLSTVESYYEHWVNLGVTGHFGTPFSWTYASGQRGKSIQLKGKII